jgi:hypothetical protein
MGLFEMGDFGLYDVIALGIFCFFWVALMWVLTR